METKEADPKGILEALKQRNAKIRQVKETGTSILMQELGL